MKVVLPVPTGSSVVVSALVYFSCRLSQRAPARMLREGPSETLSPVKNQRAFSSAPISRVE